MNDEKLCPLEIHTFTHTGSLSRSVSGPLNITLWGRDWNNVITSRVKSVYVSEALKAIEPMAWDFVINFARDNGLKVIDARAPVPPEAGGGA